MPIPSAERYHSLSRIHLERYHSLSRIHLECCDLALGVLSLCKNRDLEYMLQNHTAYYMQLADSSNVMSRDSLY